MEITPNPPPDPRGKMMDIAQVAENFRVSKRTVRRWVQMQQFPPFVRSGRQALWFAAEIERWFAEHRTATGRRRGRGRPAGG